MLPRKCWAFLVGINEYSGYTRLRYCVHDVRTLEVLLDNVGYVPVCLHDYLDVKSPKYPSRVNILHELETLLDNVSDQDLLLVYFACHGVRTAEGKPMLIVADTRKKRLEESSISILDDLEPLIRNSKAQQKVLMLDACFMGQGRGQQDPTAFLKKVNEIAKGFEVISASSEDQEALESTGLEHSIFCHFLLKGLAGEADMGQGVVMLSALKNYVVAEIAEYTVRLSLEQSPQGRSDGNLADFMLVDYTIHPRPNLDELALVEADQSKVTSIQGRGKSSADIIQCLWSLDYQIQDNVFKANTTRSRRAAAFVVQARDSRIQSWLVKRLANKIPNVAKASIFTITVPKHPMWRNRDFNEFWLELSRKLKCESEANRVIEALVKVYQTTPIVLAMYGWSTTSRSQKLQQQVIDEFWIPLLKAVEALAIQPLRSRLVLFLAEGNDTVTDISPQDPANDDSVVPLRLKPLSELTSDHVAEWLESDDVYSLLQKLMPEDQIATLINEEILEWGRDPAQTIEEICYVFNLEGIEEIQAEWRLAG